MTEALSRIHGELLSVGLEVKMIARPLGRSLGQTDTRAWLEETATVDQIDAVIEIVGDTIPVAVNVWVFDKAPRRLEVTTIALEPNTSNASETLAIRAVEVLRSTFLEHDMVARERHAEPSATPATAAMPATKQNDVRIATATPPSASQRRDKPARHLGRFGVELGAAVLNSLDGLGPAILPIAGVDWSVRSWFMVQAEVAGLGTRPTASNADGTARVAEQYGTLSGCFRFGIDGLAWPFFALSAGALHTSIEGQANSPMQGHAADRWAFLLDTGLGSGLRLPSRYYMTLAAHVQIAEPYLAIHVVDAVVAITGRPNLLLTLTVGAWL